MWIINWNATSGHPVTAGHRMTGPGTRSFCIQTHTHRRIWLLTRTNTYPDNEVPSHENGWGNFSSGFSRVRHFGHIDSLLFILRNSVASAGETVTRSDCPRGNIYFSFLSRRGQLEKSGTLILRLWYRVHESTNGDILDRVSLSTVNTSL